MFIGDAYAGPISAFFSFSLMCTIGIARSMENDKTKKNNMSNIFWMSFSDLGYSLRLCTRFFDRNPKYLFCIMDGFLGVFFIQATTSWYFLITLQIFIKLCSRTTPWCFEDRCVYHLYAWGLSLATAILAIPAYKLDSDEGTCWIIQKPSAYQLVTFIPLTIYMFFAIVVFCFMAYVIYPIRKILRQKRILMRTGVFVGVFVFTWLPDWIWTFLRAISIIPPKWFTILATFSSSLTGIINFIVWIFFYPDIYHRCREAFRTTDLRGEEQKSIQTSTASEVKEPLLKTDEIVIQGSINQGTEWKRNSSIPSGRIGTYFGDSMPNQRNVAEYFTPRDTGSYGHCKS